MSENQTILYRVPNSNVNFIWAPSDYNKRVFLSSKLVSSNNKYGLIVPAKTKYFSPLPSALTESGAQPSSYSMDIGEYYLRERGAGASGEPFSPI